MTREPGRAPPRHAHGWLGEAAPQPEGSSVCASILAWEISWTEEPGGLQSMSGRNRGLPLRRRRGQGPHLAKRWEPQVFGTGRFKY